MMSSRANSQATPEASLKSRLVDVAATLLSESKPIKLPTMREIAATAGVSLGAAYRHFKSQEDLFFEVITSLFEDLEWHIDDARSSAKNKRDGIEAVATAYVMWGLNNPGGYQLLFETTDDPKLLERGLRPGLHMVDNLSKVVSGTKKISIKDQQNVLSLWVSLHGLVSLRIHKIGMQWPNTAESEVHTILKMHMRVRS
jgi:AcrR family transcriptional regulator